jgi:hypothetical protein
MEGIPYPVEFWDAERSRWDDSIDGFQPIWAENEDDAIAGAMEYFKECIADDCTLDEDQQAERIAFYSDPNKFNVQGDVRDLDLYVFEQMTYNSNLWEIQLFTDRREAVEAAKKDWARMCDRDRREYGRGVFRVYSVTIPYSDICYDCDEPYTEDPYTEYEDYEVWNALNED